MKTGALVLAALVNIAGSSGSAGQAPAPPPAVPVGAIAGILDAFQTHAIVALSDAHGNEQAHAFLLSLIRDPRFATAVNDIVVEFGSARYQEVIDRFVRGEDIPYESLRRVWQDTTQPSAAADLPINEEFFRAVRAVNGALPRERQLRVLLGDPPIDWDKITNREEHFKWIEMRDSYPAALIQLEVITNGRRALVVYGHGHFQRRNVMSNFEMGSWEAQTIVSLLERSGPTRVFTIWRVGDVAEIQPDAPSWRVPSLATIRGTILGAADAAHYFAGGPTRFQVVNGKLAPVPKEEWKSIRAEEQLDAVLYLGPPAAMTSARWSPALCADTAYMEMRLKRIALSGIPQMEADRLKEYCASLKAK
jgi:hypothetical protein